MRHDIVDEKYLWISQASTHSVHHNGSSMIQKALPPQKYRIILRGSPKISLKMKISAKYSPRNVLACGHFSHQFEQISEFRIATRVNMTLDFLS
eukprot:TRINITY_DN11964_c0_g1_i1.p1 TRINITY_DN11964_c0_g1~~TRINITY_DN11964_c0_g1_i1.p1  ORF type:complete len:94 (-),score=6.19 TRINITY_DN11964_c0_g1_i1:14-295(-)